MPTFNLLHASDLHFRGPRGSPIARHDVSLAERLARIAVTQFRAGRIDQLLITGDVGSTGSMSDQLVAQAYFSAPHGAAAEWLTSAKLPTLYQLRQRTTIIPGNHDRYDGPLFRPGATYFDAMFGDFWRPIGSQWPLSRVAHLTTLEKDGHKVEFIGCDLSLRNTTLTPAPFSWLGWGHAARDVLSVAEQLTSRLKSISSIVVWLVHFPPDASFPLQLLESVELDESVSRAGPAFVLFGHTHAPAVRAYGGSFALTAGTATQAGEAAPSANFYRIRFDSNDLLVHFEAFLIPMKGGQRISSGGASFSRP